MSAIGGCQEGKSTPKLVEVKCPKCGEEMEVFVNMGGTAGQGGTLKTDEKCPKCGEIIPEGTPIENLEKV